MVDQASDAIARTGVDALLVDQVSPAGETVAEMLNLPFVSVCNALALNYDPALPPAVAPWRYRRGTIWRWRNALGDSILRLAARPIIREMNARRLRYGLSQLAMRIPESPGLAQIAQQPALFDFPRERLPNNFHYTGPWHAIESADKMEFPWEKLDGRPLIYASMGTLQNRQQPIFQAIATACAGLDAQLVMSLGSHDQRLDLKLPEAAIVVPFAPQLDLLRRAALTITHAGLNTALESLTQGVPMVASLSLTISRGLPQWKAEIGNIEGLRLAADIVERAVETRQPVRRP